MSYIYSEERETRWGKVKVTSEKIDHHRTKKLFEGPTDAVIAEVGRGLHGTTQCYEHMFRVDSVNSVEPGKLRVFATYNNYAGD